MAPKQGPAVARPTRPWQPQRSRRWREGWLFAWEASSAPRHKTVIVPSRKVRNPVGSAQAVLVDLGDNGSAEKPR